MEENVSGAYYPDDGLRKELASLTQILTGVSDTLDNLRREFRGETLFQDAQGNSDYIQTSKPLFVRMHPGTTNPIIIEVEVTENGKTKKVKRYVPHDEAIEEILSLLKMCGLNQVTPLGASKEDIFNLDLYEFEERLSYLLTLKRKEWGIDKSLRPMIYKKIKQQVQDARSLQVDGRTLKALTTTVQHIEKVHLGDHKSKTPYD